MRDSATKTESCLRLVRAGDRPAIPNNHLPHILLVVDQLSTILGGGERVLLQMADLLPSFGYQVTILALRVDSHSPVFEQHLPCNLYELSVRKTFGLRAFRAARELRSFIKANEIALVQTFFESSDIWVGGVTKLATNAKLVWSRRDMGILRSSKHVVAYRLMKWFPDLVFAVSEKVRRHCIDVDRIPEGKVEVTYNGIVLDKSAVSRPHVRDSPESITIATLGNIRHVKGHDIFVKAVGMIASQFPKAQFAIAGKSMEADFSDGIVKLTNELGLTDRLQFVGDVQEQSEFLEGIDIFVLPSRSEGFSNAIIEAMAAQLPVIATDVGGNAEAVIDQLTGFIIPSEDPIALADAMRKLLLDPQLARTMGLMGRKRALQCFTSTSMMETIASCYRRLLT